MCRGHRRTILSLWSRVGYPAELFGQSARQPIFLILLDLRLDEVCPHRCRCSVEEVDSSMSTAVPNGENEVLTAASDEELHLCYAVMSQLRPAFSESSCSSRL